MLAIVIPYYNIAFFEKTLRSLSNQTNKNFTTYIGNDNSSDDPAPLIREYSSSINTVYKKFSENIGKESLVKQWGRCCEMINDETWMMILGDDDCLGENVVEEFYRSLGEVDKWGINVIKFATQFIDNESKISSRKYQNAIIETSINHFYKKRDGESRSSLGEHIFKVSAYKSIGFRNYPLGWYSDDMAWLEFTNFQNIYSINTAVVYIRQGSESISGKSDNMKEKHIAEHMFYSNFLDKYFSLLEKPYVWHMTRFIEDLEKNEVIENPEKMNRLKIYYHCKGVRGIFKYIKRYYIKKIGFPTKSGMV